MYISFAKIRKKLKNKVKNKHFLWLSYDLFPKMFNIVCKIKKTITLIYTPEWF